MTLNSDISLTEMVTALRNSDIGEGLDDRILTRIAQVTNTLSLAKGDALTEVGIEGHHAYILMQGSIEVQLSESENENEANSRMLYPGAIIGEMSILESHRRAARTVAAEPCMLLCFEDEALWSLFEMEPAAGYHFMRNIARILSRRLRTTNLAIRHGFFL